MLWKPPLLLSFSSVIGLINLLIYSSFHQLTKSLAVYSYQCLPYLFFPLAFHLEMSSSLNCLVRRHSDQSKQFKNSWLSKSHHQVISLCNRPGLWWNCQVSMALLILLCLYQILCAMRQVISKWVKLFSITSYLYFQNWED